MTLPETIVDRFSETLGRLLIDITEILKSPPTDFTADEFGERLRNWIARAHEEIDSFGMREAAGRFTAASKTTAHGSPRLALIGQAHAKEANLRLLRDDVLKHREFYEAKFEKIVAEKDQQQAGISYPDARSVFLGHGRNALWVKVEMFLEKELKLQVAVWEAEPREGEHTIEVLEGLLKQSEFAVLVVTAEDDTVDGTRRARQNVIHEIGLCQGALGFKKVALLEQEGLEGCSNLHGLQTIPFSGENIETTFYRLQRMLRREGMID